MLLHRWRYYSSLNKSPCSSLLPKFLYKYNTTMKEIKTFTVKKIIKIKAYISLQHKNICVSNSETLLADCIGVFSVQHTRMYWTGNLPVTAKIQTFWYKAECSFVFNIGQQFILNFSVHFLWVKYLLIICALVMLCCKTFWKFKTTVLSWMNT
jgi:hypothetical protein